MQAYLKAQSALDAGDIDSAQKIFNEIRAAESPEEKTRLEIKYQSFRRDMITTQHILRATTQKELRKLVEILRVAEDQFF